MTGRKRTHFRYILKKRPITSFQEDADEGSTGTKRQKTLKQNTIEPLDHLFDALHRNGFKIVFTNGVGIPADLFCENDLDIYRPQDETDIVRVLGMIETNSCKVVNAENKDVSVKDILRALGVLDKDLNKEEQKIELRINSSDMYKDNKDNDATTSDDSSSPPQPTHNHVTNPKTKNEDPSSKTSIINLCDDEIQQTSPEFGNADESEMSLSQNEDVPSTIHCEARNESPDALPCVTPQSNLPVPQVKLQHNSFLPLSGENRYWNEMLSRFYKLVNSHPNLDLSLIQERDPELATWVWRQKVSCEKDWISTAKLNLLLKAGLKFEQPEESAETWKQNFALLFDFQETHGHTRVPMDSEFGQWVNRQRLKGYHDRMKPKRKMRLEGLGFEFDPNYYLRPLITTDVAVFQPAANIFRIDTVEKVGDVMLPEKDNMSNFFRIGWYLLVCGLLFGFLMVDVSFVVAVGVGLRMGYLILRGEMDVPKIYDYLGMHHR